MPIPPHANACLPLSDMRPPHPSNHASASAWGRSPLRIVSILLEAPDGDYWRLLPPGSHIVIAQAPGYSKVMKRVTIPLRMRRAGRVDFILQPLGTGPKNFLPGPSRALPRSQDPRGEPPQLDFEPPRARRQPASGSKPWWWSYFTSLTPYKPRWLLKY